MTDIDTSREAVERLAQEIAEISARYVIYDPEVRRDDDPKKTVNDAAATLLQLLAERDEARAEIERLTALCNDQASDWAPRAGRTEIAQSEAAALRALVVKMREALEAFAKHADFYNEIPGVLLVHDDVEIWQQGCGPRHGSPAQRISVGELRKAREFLALTPDDLADCVVVKRDTLRNWLDRTWEYGLTEIADEIRAMLGGRNG